MAEPLGFEVHLRLSHQEALDRVTGALKEEGFGVLTRIDVDTTLKEKIGADFRPYTILGACNPHLAHQALSQRAEVGIMLPCNVTVEAHPEGGSLVRIGNPRAMMSVGDLGQEAALQEVGGQAYEKLRRVASTLEKS
jgi:uncharacterized protein (DUF302 family)